MYDYTEGDHHKADARLLKAVVCSIDVRRLKRLRLLQVGLTYEWRWGERGRAGRMRITVVEDDELVFEYQVWDERGAPCGKTWHRKRNAASSLKLRLI